MQIDPIGLALFVGTRNKARFGARAGIARISKRRFEAARRAFLDRRVTLSGVALAEVSPGGTPEPVLIGADGAMVGPRS